MLTDEQYRILDRYADHLIRRLEGAVRLAESQRLTEARTSDASPAELRAAEREWQARDARHGGALTEEVEWRP